MTTIYKQPMGEYTKLTLKHGQDSIGSNLFRNLSWLCIEYVPENEFESFVGLTERINNGLTYFKDMFKIVEIPQDTKL